MNSRHRKAELGAPLSSECCDAPLASGGALPARRASTTGLRSTKSKPKSPSPTVRRKISLAPLPGENSKGNKQNTFLSNSPWNEAWALNFDILKRQISRKKEQRMRERKREEGGKKERKRQFFPFRFSRTRSWLYYYHTVSTRFGIS